MNIATWIRKRAFDEPEAMTLKDGDLCLSNLEFYRRVLGVVFLLRSRGIKKGDRVAVLLYNSSLFLELFFACAHMGAIFVPLNYRLAPAELDYMIGHCKCSLLVFDPDFEHKTEDVELSRKSVLSAVLDDNPLFPPFDTAEPTGRRQMLEEALSNDAPLSIMYTSGTTGRPKGATLSHGNFQWNAIMHLLNGHYREKALATAPLYHVAGLCTLATPILYEKGSLVIQRSFDPRTALQLIAQEQLTYMVAVPTMLDMMVRDPFFETTDFSSLRYIISAGSPAPVELIERFHEKGVKVNQGYGLTEGLGVSNLTAEYAVSKAGSCGRPYFHVEIRLVDETGSDLPQGEVGEIIVKSPNVMLGYWRDPEATRETLRDGWLWTGDLARQDSEGFVYIVDRKNDLIISGGENIYPAEVEAVLLQHSAVAAVAVIGVPDEKWGEVPLAYVVLESGARAKPARLIEHCHSKIARYKAPKHFRFVQDLPKTPTGKVIKKALPALSENEL